MYRFILTSISVFFFTVFIGTTILAQDRIVVQTLTYDSTSRSGNFTFPDKSEGPFKKILMKYAIRCHDAAVGSGNVGCREWDYSCNTFITDSSLVDSTLAFQASYSITNYTDDLFPYRRNALPSYIERVQQINSITKTNKDETHTLTGIKNNDLILSMGTTSGLETFIYEAQNLSEAGVRADKIYGLSFKTNSDNGRLINLRISLKLLNNNDKHFDAVSTNNYQQVYFSNVAVDNKEIKLIFDEGFDWDGKSDLGIQMNWDEVRQDEILLSTHQQTQSRSTYSKEDWAFQLNGTQAINVPSSTFDEIDNEISICYWAFGNPAILPKNTSSIEAVDATNKRQINIHFPWSNGQIYWDCGKVGASGYDRINKPAPLELTEGKWNFWAFTKNATTGVMNIYVNGKLWHTGSGKSAPIGSIDRTIIGQSANITSAYNGKLSDFTIWNRALNEDELKIVMLTAEELPNFNDNLQLAYLLNQTERSKITDYSLHGNHGQLIGYSDSWHSLRGFEKRHRSAQLGWTDNLPDISFYQGDYDIDSEEIEVRDSVFNLPNRVIKYEIKNNDLIALDTQYLWDANEIVVYNEAGDVIDFYDVTPEGEIDIETLQYFNKRPAKFELLSMVTPYGNGLDLGENGVQFTIDVSDFAPILHGDKYLNMQMGGQNQEEVDIQFEFIKGIPYQEVKSIENIWPFARGWFRAIQDDQTFEPRMIVPNKDASIYKVKMSITGHGQNGEFQKRNHFFNINGGAKEFYWDVWKECSIIPIYPQGGTWIFDRAGWCPGDPTLITELDISNYVQPGKAIEMDYGVNGLHIDEANYLVSSQLVSYGPPTKSLDIDLIDIVSPSKKIEYLRFNPACNEPKIKVKNIGTEEITSLKIQYRVVGGKSQEYIWNGSIDYLEEDIIALPLWIGDFWATAVGQDDNLFEAKIISINNKMDEDADNNILDAQFDLPDIHDKDNMRFEYRTNTRGRESSYTLKDRNGKVLYENNNLSNSTTYNDDLELGPGCYTLEFRDSGDDGLYYWFWERTTPRGKGYARLTYKKGSRYRTIKNFEPEFGRFFRYDFAVKDLTATEGEEGIQFLLSTYPNPVNEQLNVDIILPQHASVDFSIMDDMGTVLHQRSEVMGKSLTTLQFETGDLVSGLYILTARVNGKVYQRKFVKF